ITAFWMHPERSWRRGRRSYIPEKGFADLCQQSAILERSRRPAKDRGEARAQGGTPKVFLCRGSLCPRHALWNWRNNHAVLRESTWHRASSYRDAYCATMRSSEKFSSTYWRRARGLISMFFTRLAISRTVRHMYPEIQSRTISGTEPPRRAKTGVPHAIASTMTRPKGSIH